MNKQRTIYKIEIIRSEKENVEIKIIKAPYNNVTKSGNIVNNVYLYKGDIRKSAILKINKQYLDKIIYEHKSIWEIDDLRKIHDIDKFSLSIFTLDYKEELIDRLIKCYKWIIKEMNIRDNKNFIIYDLEELDITEIICGWNYPYNDYIWENKIIKNM